MEGCSVTLLDKGGFYVWLGGAFFAKGQEVAGLGVTNIYREGNLDSGRS